MERLLTLLILKVGALFLIALIAVPIAWGLVEFHNWSWTVALVVVGGCAAFLTYSERGTSVVSKILSHPIRQSERN